MLPVLTKIVNIARDWKASCIFCRLTVRVISFGGRTGPYSKKSEKPREITTILQFTRKSSCVNRRGIPPSAQQVFAVLIPSPSLDLARVSTSPPPKGVDKQTETITFPRPTDEGGNKTSMCSLGRREFTAYSFQLVLTSEVTLNSIMYQ